MAVINVQTPIVKRLFGRTVLAIKDIKKLAAEGRFWPNPACHDRPVPTRSGRPIQIAGNYQRA